MFVRRNENKNKTIRQLCSTLPLKHPAAWRRNIVAERVPKIHPLLVFSPRSSFDCVRRAAAKIKARLRRHASLSPHSTWGIAQFPPLPLTSFSALASFSSREHTGNYLGESTSHLLKLSKCDNFYTRSTKRSRAPCEQRDEAEIVYNCLEVSCALVNEFYVHLVAFQSHDLYQEFSAMNMLVDYVLTPRMLSRLQK